MNPHERAVQELLQARKLPVAAPSLPAPVGELKFCFAPSRDEPVVLGKLAPPKPPTLEEPSFDAIQTRYALP